MINRWFGLTLLKKIPKGFSGIVLEDNQDEFLVLSRYVRGSRETICEIKLSEITDALVCLEDADAQKSNFLHKFLVLASELRSLSSVKIYSTYEVQEVILDEYCSYFQVLSPANSTDEFPDFFSDEFPDDFPDEFYE